MSNWFAQCQTIEQARLEYRRLCLEHHPDHGGDTSVMQAINVAYSRFKAEHLQTRPARTQPHSPWQRPSRYRPADVPPTNGTARAKAERQALHSRDYIHHIWTQAPWQQLSNGNLGRSMWGHTIILVQHPAPKYQGAWFVMFDNAFSPYFYDTRREAEEAAFEILYDRVKYLEL